MSPVLFTIGNFNVYAFGFFLALAFLFSTFIVWKNAKEVLREEEYLDAYLFTNIAALVSARAFYIIFHFEDFGFNLLQYIVVTQTPGLSLLGGLLGGVVFLFWYAQRSGESLWKLLDLFSLAGSFALALAKIGEQLGGAGFGRETTFIFGVKTVGLPGRYHPVELYEAILFLILTGILYLAYRKVARNIWPQGLVGCIFAVGLSVIIFTLEFLKDYRLYLYGLSLRQISAVVIFVVTALPLIKRLRRLKGVK